MKIEEIARKFRYSIQDNNGVHTLRNKNETLLKGSWDDCVKKIQEIEGEIEVEFAVVMNATFIWFSEPYEKIAKAKEILGEVSNIPAYGCGEEASMRYAEAVVRTLGVLK